MLHGSVLHYEIVKQIGAGAMGEVYLATDTRLERQVALKVLPNDFAKDESRIRRFAREAKVLAGLTHGGIAAVHGLEEVEGRHILALEYVPGDNLDDKLRQGRLPIEEALQIARQVAEAVEAAHEKGIIHRDLKPANIRITPDGTAKVLDFGLAKEAVTRPGTTISAVEDVSEAALTADGVVLGTAPYMSPEQARGKTLDKRTDIWAFGCVLYEMLTGACPFDGPDFVTVLNTILVSEPDWEKLPPRTPRRVRRVLRRCLEKDPRRRLRDIGDARIELDLALQGREWSTAEAAAVLGPVGSWRVAVVLPWLVAAAALILAVWRPWDTAAATNTRSSRREVFYLTSAATDVRLIGYDGIPIALSRDGSYVALVSNGLWLRAMDSNLVREVGPGGRTSSGVPRSAYNPFFSPDGKWLAYFEGRSLYKVTTTGAISKKIAGDLEGVCKGGCWTTQGRIVFSQSPNTGLWSISPDGDMLELLTTPDRSQKELSHRWPAELPGGRGILFTIKTSDITSFDNAKIGVLDLHQNKTKILLSRGTCARYAPPGYLLFCRAGKIFAAPFHLDTLSVEEDKARVVHDGVLTEPGSGAAAYALTDDGTLAYVSGGSRRRERELVWMDRGGNTTPAWPHPRPFFVGSLSPDGNKVAAILSEASDALWLFDLQKQTSDRLTFEGNCTLPRWSGNGAGVLFMHDRGDSRLRLYRKQVDGAGAARLVAEGLPQSHKDLVDKASFYDLSPDGKWLAVEHAGDVSLLPTDGSVPVPLATTRFQEQKPAFSPNGNFVAYVSNEGDGWDVYVRGVPPGRGKWRVTNRNFDSPGPQPLWSRDGAELFHHRATTILRIAVVLSPRFEASRPVSISVGRLSPWGYNPARKQFLCSRGVDEAQVLDVCAIRNWTTVLEEKVPSSGR